MSYITPALKRAQKSNDDKYLPYRDIISAKPRHKVRGRKRLILGVSLAALVLLASTAFSVIIYVGQEVPVKEEVSLYAAPVTIRAKIDATARKQAIPHSTNQTQAAEILFQAGLRRQQAGDSADAEALYRKAIEINPNNLSALNNVGVLCMHQKRDSEAIDIFYKLIDAKGDWSDPYYNLACLFSRQGDSPKGLKYLRIALWLNKDLREWARNDSDLEPLRSRAEYHRIVD
ncbi:MAG TPA: tetratricopeptide repeat protein [Syntrophales bacterium]|nr:tetratricopeptide repeat protein [Syntrophales bacterium]